jgi:hypothetical protein
MGMGIIMQQDDALIEFAPTLFLILIEHFEVFDSIAELIPQSLQLRAQVTLASLG